MTTDKVIRPVDVWPALARRQGILFDVRESMSAPVPGVSHYHFPVSEIEKFMIGTLSGERVQSLVSTLIFLASKWRSAYIVADTDADGMAVAGHLTKLGFRDSFLVRGGVDGLPFGLAHWNRSKHAVMTESAACL